MNEDELRTLIADSFRDLVTDVADAQAIETDDNPFDRVVLSEDFMNARLSSPILNDEELKTVLEGVDEAIEQKKALTEVVDLVSKGLGFLAKLAI